MNSKKQSRLRRARKTRAKISELLKPRLSVHRSGRHLYAQLIAEDGQRVLAAANTLQGDVKKGLKSFCNVKAAEKIGARIAKAAVKAGVTEVAFDRSGFKYHGKIKALADSAREAGLKF